MRSRGHRTGREGFTSVGQFEGKALIRKFEGSAELDADDEASGDGVGMRVEHFGFRDGLSQPRFKGIGSRVDPARGDERCPGKDPPYDPLGVVLLGHPSGSPVGVPVPIPHALGYQGSFNAFRVLAQDVGRFRAFVADQACALGVEEELLKAKLCGRWPNGVPLALACTAEEAVKVLRSCPDVSALNRFDFSDDQDGATCPVGSHVRRTNPRAAQIVQRPSSRNRRLVRRGMPFGPWLGAGEEQGNPRERGLLGSFLCASLSSQFEAMQYDWINLGLQDPSITSTNDPLAGANRTTTSSFSFTAGGVQHLVQAIPRFVETMGGAYCFLPSMSALDWIANARWSDPKLPAA